MGKPEEPEQFVPLVVGEWGRRYGTVYVARAVWDGLKPSARQFTFYHQEGGRCRLYFDAPVFRLKT